MRWLKGRWDRMSLIWEFLFLAVILGADCLGLEDQKDLKPLPSVAFGRRTSGACGTDRAGSYGLPSGGRSGCLWTSAFSGSAFGKGVFWRRGYYQANGRRRSMSWP